MPLGRPMETVDERLVRAPSRRCSRSQETWRSGRLISPHYRYVRFRRAATDGGGIGRDVGGPAVRLPVGRIRINWPTWWLSEMSVDDEEPAIRFRHIGGITKGMDVEWTFRPRGRRHARTNPARVGWAARSRSLESRRRRSSSVRCSSTESRRARWPGWRLWPSARQRIPVVKRGSSESKRRVVITGLAPITPIGTTVEGLWEGLRRERSAVGSVTRFDPSQFRSHNAAEVNDFVPTDYLETSARSASIATASSPLRRADGDRGCGISTSPPKTRPVGSTMGTRTRRRCVRREPARPYTCSEGLRAVDPMLALACSAALRAATSRSSSASRVRTRRTR